MILILMNAMPPILVTIMQAVLIDQEATGVIVKLDTVAPAVNWILMNVQATLVRMVERVLTWLIHLTVSVLMNTPVCII